MIKRIETGPRMSEAVVHNGVVYLAGQVADDASQDIAGQTPGRLGTAVGAVISKNSDKGGGERPLGKEISQQVGDTEGDDKGVVGKTCAEQSGKDLFPDETKDTAAHHGDAHRPGGTGYFSGGT